MLTLRRYGDPTLPALVLLHGFLGNKDDWRGIVPQLSEHFYCICLDLPGHGDSTQQTIPTPGFDACVDLILASLDDEGVEQFHLHGYSLGGRIALHIADKLQQDNSPRLLSLSLESCHPGLTDPEQIKQRQHNDDVWADKLITLALEDFLRHWYQQSVFAELSDFERLRLIQNRSRNKPISLYNCYRATSLALQKSLWHLPSSLSIPCHYYLGNEDKKFLSLGEKWQSLGQLQLHRFDHAGHNVHLAQPQAFIHSFIRNTLGQHK